MVVHLSHSLLRYTRLNHLIAQRSSYLVDMLRPCLSVLLSKLLPISLILLLVLHCVKGVIQEPYNSVGLGQVSSYNQSQSQSQVMVSHNWHQDNIVNGWNYGIMHIESTAGDWPEMSCCEQDSLTGLPFEITSLCLLIIFCLCLRRLAACCFPIRFSISQIINRQSLFCCWRH